MSRSGLTDDCEDAWELIRWRGAVASAIRGKQGQAFLKELAAAMDAMENKRLISGALACDGEFCTLGVIGNARGIDLSKIDPYETDRQAQLLNVNEKLVQEIAYLNDEWCSPNPEKRFELMRKWVADNIRVQS